MEVIKMKKAVTLEQLRSILSAHFDGIVGVDSAYTINKGGNFQQHKTEKGCTLILDIRDKVKESATQKDPIDSYKLAYDKVAEVKAVLDGEEKRKTAAKLALLSHMESLGLDSIGRDEYSISIHKRIRAQVKDYAYLLEWVMEQDEPMNEYTKIVFRMDVLGDIIRDAQVKALGSKAELPPGLGYGMYDVVTVRVRKKTKLKETITNVEMLDEV